MSNAARQKPVVILLCLLIAGLAVYFFFGSATSLARHEFAADLQQKAASVAQAATRDGKSEVKVEVAGPAASALRFANWRGRSVLEADMTYVGPVAVRVGNGANTVMAVRPDYLNYVAYKGNVKVGEGPLSHVSLKPGETGRASVIAVADRVIITVDFMPPEGRATCDRLGIHSEVANVPVVGLPLYDRESTAITPQMMALVDEMGEAAAHLNDPSTKQTDDQRATANPAAPVTASASEPAAAASQQAAPASTAKLDPPAPTGAGVPVSVDNGYKDFKWGMSEDAVRGKVADLKQTDEPFQLDWALRLTFIYTYADLYEVTMPNIAGQVKGKETEFESKANGSTTFLFVDAKLVGVAVYFSYNDSAAAALAKKYGSVPVRHTLKDSKTSVWANAPDRLIVWDSGGGFGETVYYLDRHFFNTLAGPLVEQRNAEKKKGASRLD
jgi:hypothetical protein